jgi:hypothetical protein
LEADGISTHIFFCLGGFFGFNFSNAWKADRVQNMKRFLYILFFAASAFAEELPPAPKILAATRAQLPPLPVEMKGVLKQWASNGFMKKALDVEMTLDWNAIPAQAEYKISDSKNDFVQTVKIFWKESGVEFDFSENGEKKELNPFDQILDSGVTWIDLTFSFLWNQQAETIGTDRKFFKECYLISIPRPGGNTMKLWVEKETGRLLGAEEYNADGDRLKVIKVVSVRKFDDLWMVEDLDIIQPAQGTRTSLRVDEVNVQEADL